MTNSNSEKFTNNDTIQIAKDDIINRMSPHQKEVYDMIVNTIKEFENLENLY